MAISSDVPGLDDNEMFDSDTDDDEEVEEGNHDNGIDSVEEYRVVGEDLCDVPGLDDNRDDNEMFDSDIDDIDIDDDEVVEEGDDDNGMDGVEEHHDEVVEEGDDDNGMDGVEEHLGLGVQDGDGGCGERDPYFYICECCLEVVTHNTDSTAVLCEPCQNVIDRLHQFTGVEIPNTSIIVLKHPYNMEMLSSEDDAAYIKYYDAVMQVFDESFDGYRAAKQSMDNRFLYIFCNLLHGQPISVCTLQLLGCDIGIIGMAATVQRFRKNGSCRYLIQIMEQKLREHTSFKTLMVASLSTTVKYWSKIGFFNIPKDQELNLRSKFNLDYYRSCTILAKKL